MDMQERLDEIKEWLQSTSYSTAELSRLTGLGQTTIRQFRSNPSGSPKMETIEAFEAVVAAHPASGNASETPQVAQEKPGEGGQLRLDTSEPLASTRSHLTVLTNDSIDLQARTPNAKETLSVDAEPVGSELGIGNIGDEPEERMSPLKGEYGAPGRTLSEVPASNDLDGLRNVMDRSECEPDNIRRPHKPKQELFIPVHGFVWLSQAEVYLVDHPAFQRLRRVKQLGIAHEVYPGATHTRFEHVIGVLHITQRIIEAIAKNHERFEDSGKSDFYNESSHWGKVITPWEARYIRLAALMHDIGHLPFGHSLEDELGVLNHHDQEDRLRLVLQRRNPTPVVEESVSELLEHYYKLPVSTLATINQDISPEDLVISIILHGPTRDIRLAYKEKLEAKRRSLSGRLVTEADIVETFAEDLARIGIRLNVCADIVGNTICADLLDYLHRDWHHVGKSRYLDDRALHYMEIRSDQTINANPTAVGLAPNDRFVLNLGRYPRLRTDAVSLILELLESRYSLAEAVLFHRSKLKLTAMMERCLSLTFDPSGVDLEFGWDRDLEKRLLGLSDDSFLEQLCETNPSFPTRTLCEEDRLQRIRLAYSIRDRHLFKHVHTISYVEGRPEAIMRFQNLHTGGRRGATARERALRQAEADFGLKVGELAMYCPSPKMNSKIAQVKVLIGGELHQLDIFDQNSVDKLAAGHLAAQIEI